MTALTSSAYCFETKTYSSLGICEFSCDVDLSKEPDKSRDMSEIVARLDRNSSCIMTCCNFAYRPLYPKALSVCPQLGERPG